MWMKKKRKNYDEAKEIFIKYNGSHFQMEREFEYSKYKSYRVPKEMERTWINELEEKKFDMLEIESNESIIVDILIDLEQILVQYKDENGLLLIVKYAKNITKFDTFTKLIIAEIILNIIRELKLNNSQIDAINFAITILEDICIEPVTISQSHLNNGNVPDYMSEAILRNRAKKEIMNWKRDEV